MQESLTSLPEKAPVEVRARRGRGHANGRRANQKRRETTWWQKVIGVFGELLITAGIFVLLFVGWKMTFNDAQINQVEQDKAASISHEWNKTTPRTTGTVQADPVVMQPKPADKSYIGVLYAERLGKNWQRPVVAGTATKPILDRLGSGWYTNTAVPGALGNMAIASHRGGNGSNFRYLDTFRLGDRIVLETKDGWYVYSYRNAEYVMASSVNVVNPVPQTDQSPDGRILTLTTCNPYPFTNGERLIVYSTFDGFYPRSGGAPAVLDYLKGN